MIGLKVNLNDYPEDRIFNVISEPYIAYNRHNNAPNTYIMVCDSVTNKISEINVNELNKKIYLDNGDK